MKMFVLEGKVALITGGASGIGLQYAKELLRNGLKACTLADINEEYGNQAVQEIEQEFGKDKTIFIKTDVTVKTEFEDAFKATVTTFKNIDILINNAGILNDNTWEKEIQINLNGTVHGCLLGLEEYLPKYKSGDEAVIVNVASVTGLDPFGAIPIYSAIKHAIVGLSRSLSITPNYERTKVKILTICPGLTDTPMLDNDRLKSIHLTPAYKQFVGYDFNHLWKQPSIFVAQSMIRIIQEGENGSVWIVEHQEPLHEVTFTHRLEKRKTFNSSLTNTTYYNKQF